MPTYEYECTKCKDSFEVKQPMSQSPLRDCTKCNNKDVLTKIISASGFSLKGTGWYVTDFKDN
jgi:putative FmdB family regulatory protein